MSITEVLVIIKRWGLISIANIDNMLKTVWMNDISVDLVESYLLLEIGGRIGTRNQNIPSSIMGHTSFIILGTRNIRLGTIWLCLDLGTDNTGVTSSYVCICFCKRFHQRKRECVLKLFLIWPGWQYRWGRKTYTGG